MVIGLFNASWNSLAMITLRRGGRYVRRWRPKPENEKKFRGRRQSAPDAGHAALGRWRDTASTSRRVPSYIDLYKERNIVEPILNIVARVGSLTHPSLTFSECSLVGTRRIHRLGVRPERTT
jgi:hypothetical protein